jgi:DNA-binding NarL/FixJ family response regulator
MPLLNGLDAGYKQKRSMPNTKLIFLTVNEDPDVARKAFRIGASGYVSKHSVASELLQAIRYALCGKSYLTPLISKDQAEVFRGKVRKQDGEDLPTVRQKQVLQLLAEGYSMKKAAALLRITPRTVAFHKYRMMEACGLKTNVDLYQFAVKLGLLVGFSPH